MNAVLGQIKQLGQFSTRESRALGSTLQFNHAAATGHHDVHVGIACGIFGVIQIQYRSALVNAN